jgi:hypothetical protein
VRQADSQWVLLLLMLVLSWQQWRHPVTPPLDLQQPSGGPQAVLLLLLLLLGVTPALE